MLEKYLQLPTLSKNHSRETRLGQKCLTPRNKKKLTKVAFQIFVNFGLFKKELLLLPPFIRF
ncbi:hypothetical protein F6X86_01025 [Enterococcus durans]|uniref:Uncharacterized protein n=1 Tax=Enterococcus durans TaxID=53345 RepID=A0A5N0YYR9_9ENTE|nr:hypothetical protein F6X86_01025 [Enterococcus durans]TKN21033.1 hypothetical protein DVW83_00770 [Enterococcus sp. VV15]KAA9188655.1 hypothetical protein F6X90_00865 [Enterococcus durans]KAA9189071.1 hypothetical protein F6X85_00865 [Enterococcus durans]KAA9195042.1 hypothetical protein F6Y12_00865 [Enterococcus durans]